VYLDRLFENPILVRLVSIKDKGKQGLKLQFNTIINYEGEEYNDIEEFSDSERQRCDIAFLLAVNDMIGSNLLMLDETDNCMNSEMDSDVLGVIHDMCGHKLILMISHSAVRGVFDAEIAISH
jgi:ABC-type transport system involved in cytochrome bd biosynthesis fused ATPase/permease subunit